MITKKQKRKKRSESIIFPVIFVILIFSALAFLVTSNLKISRKRKELLSQINYLTGEINKLEQEKGKLTEEVSQGGSEENLEEKLREDLLLKKTGEEVVSIVEEEITTEPEIEIEEEKSFLDKVLEFLRIK